MPTFIDVQIELQKLTKSKVTLTGIGKALGTGRSNISGRAKHESQVTPKELALIENAYNVKLNFEEQNEQSLHSQKSLVIGDRIEIPYWNELPEELKNPKIASVWFDREIIENDWKISPEHLCIIPMIGDKMTNYWYPIRNNDILMIDTSQSYIMGNGVYFATSRNNTRFWIREMQILLDQTMEINGFAPSGNTRKVFTNPDLQQADFKIIGKVIKNVSFRL